MLRFENILSCKFLTQFDLISRPLIAFSRAAAEINNKDTLKVCRKSTKITDPNLGLFLAMGRIWWWNSSHNFKNYWFKSIFIDRNYLLSIIIDGNCFLLIIIDFCANAWNAGMNHCADLGYLFLGERAHSSRVRMLTHKLSNHMEFLLSVPGSQMYLEHVSIKIWNLTLLRLPAVFCFTAKLRFPT